MGLIIELADAKCRCRIICLDSNESSYKFPPFLTFSAALGIARTSSALHSLARKLAAARHSPSKLGLCARLAQTFFLDLLGFVCVPRGQAQI